MGGVFLPGIDILDFGDDQVEAIVLVGVALG